MHGAHQPTAHFQSKLPPFVSFVIVYCDRQLLVQELTSDGYALFPDGQKLGPVDAVIYCTGWVLLGSRMGRFRMFYMRRLHISLPRDLPVSIWTALGHHPSAPAALGHCHPSPPQVSLHIPLPPRQRDPSRHWPL